MASATVMSSITRTAAATASSTLRAPKQGGILEGSDPSVYDPKNPIIHFIIQAGIIIIFCRLLHWPLSKIRQPRVIAEVIGGILLGPSVMGRIPGFKAAIFPDASMSNLNLVANIGLVLFLFLVGLEVDLRFLVSNWKVALSVGFAGMALPFGLGCAIAWGLYHEFRHDEGLAHISFGVYMLFIGVAMAITAFPVLCRILTELKLLSTPVGIIVLSAGVGNDVVGWVLLALCVALVNAGTGLTALWVLLVCAGYTLFLAFIARPLIIWFLTKKTRSLVDGPSQTVIGFTLLLALASSFFTGVIGVHPIFGAFLAGLILPHDGGFAIKVTEKVEDLVSTLFLPLYFALSGLSTNLGLLDSGMTWAYVFGVIFVAFFAKIIGGSGAARLNGLVWRECFTIGALMSCKGLVELIVLNIGLQARILSQRTFTIFVVMALVTTFATTPLVSALYPPWYQRKLEAWKRGNIDWDTGLPPSPDDSRRDSIAPGKQKANELDSMLVYLRLDALPGLMTFISMFSPQVDVAGSTVSSNTTITSKQKQRPVELHAIRLIPLTERDSSVMRVSETASASLFDPVVNALRAFARLHRVPLLSADIAVIPEHSYADTLTARAQDLSADLLLIPWSEGVGAGLSDEGALVPAVEDGSTKATLENRIYADEYATFARDTLHEGRHNVNIALFIGNGFGGASIAAATATTKLHRSFSHVSARSPAVHNGSAADMGDATHRIFVPFWGSRDDRVALAFALRLIHDPRVKLTIAHIKTDSSDETDEDTTSASQSKTSSARRRLNGAVGAVSAAVKKTSGVTTTTSETEHIPLADRTATFLASTKSSLPIDVQVRVEILSETSEGSHGAEKAAEIARRVVGSRINNLGDLCIVGRNELGDANAAADSVLGALADKLVHSGIDASLVVVQAAAGQKGEME